MNCSRPHRKGKTHTDGSTSETEHRMRICERIQSLQRALYSESRSSVSKSRRSVSSKSPSHKSSLLSASLARAEAAAKAAKAKIEMEFLEKETELELIRLESSMLWPKQKTTHLKGFWTTFHSKVCHFQQSQSGQKV